jgi:uncharacterized protein (UPF0332 family)
MRRGNEALAAALHLVAGSFYSDAISRAYYAAFHWACALLLTKGLEARSHRGTIQLLTLHFVKDGALAAEAAAQLGHLETFRELGDYTSAAKFTKADAEDAILRAEQFIAACRPLLAGYAAA